MLRYEIKDREGHITTFDNQDHASIYGLIRMLEKCQIEWFKISLK